MAQQLLARNEAPATRAPSALVLRPIDDAARDGRYRLLASNGRFAVGCWRASPAGGEWTFPGGEPVGFTPVEYQP